MAQRQYVSQKKVASMDDYTCTACTYVMNYPKGAIDPNSGQGIAKNREITIFKKYWTNGWSKPIAVRFNGNDTYAKFGWRYPVEQIGKIKKYKPIRSKTASNIDTIPGKILSQRTTELL